eukprot:symbB.v1.2.010442.t1/scaffold680.1/size173138/5
MEQLPRFHGGTVTTQMRNLYRSSSMLHRRNLPLQLSSEDRDLSSLSHHYDLVTYAIPDPVSVLLKCFEIRLMEEIRLTS